jgi:hypothetical protein
MLHTSINEALLTSCEGKPSPVVGRAERGLVWMDEIIAPLPIACRVSRRLVGMPPPFGQCQCSRSGAIQGALRGTQGGSAHRHRRRRDHTGVASASNVPREGVTDLTIRTGEMNEMPRICEAVVSPLRAKGNCPARTLTRRHRPGAWLGACSLVAFRVTRPLPSYWVRRRRAERVQFDGLRRRIRTGLYRPQSQTPGAPREYWSSFDAPGLLRLLGARLGSTERPGT